MPAPKPQTPPSASKAARPVSICALYMVMFILSLGVAYAMIQILLPGIASVPTAPMIIVFFGFSLGALAFFVFWLAVTVNQSATPDDEDTQAKKLI